MARMHSRAKGKSGSKAPQEKSVPEWLEYTPEQIEELVVKLYNDGMTQSIIGLNLRDSYGIPDVKLATGKSIQGILEDKKLAPEIPEDMMSLLKKSVKLYKHMKENKKDMAAKRGYQLTVSKIRRIAKFYTKKGKLPSTWRYDPEAAQLLMK